MLSLFIKMNGWIAAIPLLIGVLALYAFLAIGSQARLLTEEGVETDATIIAKRIDFRRSGTGSSTRQKTPVVRFHFSLEGKLHYGEKDVPRNFYDSVELTQTTPVRYLPSDPDVHEIVEGAISGNSLAAGIVGAVFALMGAALAWLVFRAAARALKIRDNGEEATATVTDKHKNGLLQKIAFSFPGPEGEQTGESLPRPAKRHTHISVGDEIRVCFDPDNPAKVYWRGDVGPRPSPIQR